MEVPQQLTTILIYFYASGIHIGFVIISKKCFFERYSLTGFIMLFLLSPSLGVTTMHMLTDSIYFGESINDLLRGHMIYFALVALIVAIQLPLYLWFVKPQNKSVAAFIYLSCLTFMFYNDFVENVYDNLSITGNTWVKNILMLIAAAVFYRFVILPLSRVSRIKQDRSMAVFVIIPVVAIAIKIVLLLLKDVSNEYSYYGTRVGTTQEYISSSSVLGPYFKDFVKGWELYREVYTIACYSMIAMLIIAFIVIVRNVIQLNEISRQNLEIQAARDDVKELSVEVMEALAHTIDAKDKYTNGHSIRVAQYSRMIATKMGLSAENCENIYYMGLLHDIGKIGVPNEIINKPKKLTDSEYEVIKTHPTIGYGILSEIKTRPDLAKGAYWHHERYDGKGYPAGLSGEDIPLEARIIAVADSYDAMTSNRSYRDYLPQDVVRSELEKNKNTQFDPDIADVMISIIDEDKDYSLHEMSAAELK